MSEDEIFDAGYHAWTGKWSLDPWIAGNTCVHYNRAKTQVRITKIRRERAA